MGRAPCCDKANVKRGPWSPEEDATLRNYVQAHGIGGNWIALPRKAGLRRCGKSCRLRWLNYLRPDIKHGGFTEEEDTIICAIYNQLGSRWSIIASQLPGRTDNDVKNYWNTKLKKKLAKINTTNLPNPFTSPPPPPSPAVAVLAAAAAPPPPPSGFPPLMLNQGFLASGISINNIVVKPEFGATSDQAGPSTSDHSSTGMSCASYFSGTTGGGRGAAEDDGVLMDFGMENLPYDIINGFWFQEKGSGGTTDPPEVLPPVSSSLDELSLSQQY